MKDRITEYVNELFHDVLFTKQILDLKEEITINLYERTMDLINEGKEESEALNIAIHSLGDFTELVESLPKASIHPKKEEVRNMDQFTKSETIQIVVGSIVVVTGSLIAGILYLLNVNYFSIIGVFLLFLIIGLPFLMYAGLIHESSFAFGMNKQRATFYIVSTELLVLAALIVDVLLSKRSIPYIVPILIAMPFVLISIAGFIYLGLTEPNRVKINPNQKMYLQHHTLDSKQSIIYGNISGMLWISSFAIFFLVSFTIGWKISWIVFIFAVVLQLLIETIFAAKSN